MFLTRRQRRPSIVVPSLCAGNLVSEGEDSKVTPLCSVAPPGSSPPAVSHHSSPQHRYPMLCSHGEQMETPAAPMGSQDRGTCPALAHSTCSLPGEASCNRAGLWARRAPSSHLQQTPWWMHLCTFIPKSSTVGLSPTAVRRRDGGLREPARMGLGFNCWFTACQQKYMAVQ